MFYRFLFAIFMFTAATTYAQQDEMDFFLSVEVLGNPHIAHSSPCGKELFPQNYLSTKENVIIRKYETSAVNVCVINNLKFHIADYSDTTRVVTALDGEKRGYQGVSVGGIKTAESTKVEWQNNCFVHTYPSGKIYSYPDRQVIEHY